MIEDKEIVAYIATGMKNEYIRLSKKNCLITKNETPLLDDMQIADTTDNNTTELRIQIEEALKQLTELQRKIIYEVIVKGKKEKEVASELGSTRQAVNKSKKSALEKLKILLKDALT